MDYSILTDQELADIRASLPKYTNDQTPIQAETDQLAYTEQMRRHKAAIADYNQCAIEATGLHHGDRVEATLPGMFMSSHYYTGKVIYNRSGKLVVRTDRPDGAGRKFTPISKAWKKRS